MASEIINAWDKRVLAASEGALGSGFGTTPAPAASQVLEFVDIDLGPIEVGEIRAKKDRAVGRGMTTGYVKGRVKPMPWTVNVANKSRSAADTVPGEAALMKAAGMVQTVTGATSVAYSLSGAPHEAGAFSGLSLMYRNGLGGSTPNAYLGEQMRGGVTKQIAWSFGDRELMTKFSGDGTNKYHLGYAPSVTLANGSATSLTFADAEEGYRFGNLGWYQIESEIVLLYPMDYATFTATLTRGQVSTSGAAHTAKPMYPYFPSVSYSGSPISEVNCSVVLGGQTFLFQSGEISFTTGLELGPGETGSKWAQTVLAKRYDCKAVLKGLMRREQVSILGKATEQKTPLALSVVCGTGAGGIVTFSAPYCEIDATSLPDDGNGPQMISIPLRMRDNSGNDMLTVTYT